jgi:homospermidine synthase
MLKSDLLARFEDRLVMIGFGSIGKGKVNQSVPRR